MQDIKVEPLDCVKCITSILVGDLPLDINFYVYYVNRLLVKQILTTTAHYRRKLFQSIDEITY